MLLRWWWETLGGSGIEGGGGGVKLERRAPPTWRCFDEECVCVCVCVCVLGGGGGVKYLDLYIGQIPRSSPPPRRSL